MSRPRSPRLGWTEQGSQVTPALPCLAHEPRLRATDEVRGRDAGECGCSCFAEALLDRSGRALFPSQVARLDTPDILVDLRIMDDPVQFCEGLPYLRGASWIRRR